MALEVLPDPGEFDYESDGALATPTAIPASGTSSMGTLRERLAKQKAERTYTHFVLDPIEGDPGILVEYRPIGWEELEGIRVAHKKADKKKIGILVGTDVLITCCLGIYLAEHDDKDRRHEWAAFTDDDPTTYSSTELAGWLSDPEKGLEVRTARQAVRNLYATDGDVMAQGDAVVKFSGYLGEDEANRPN